MVESSCTSGYFGEIPTLSSPCNCIYCSLFWGLPSANMVNLDPFISGDVNNLNHCSMCINVNWNRIQWSYIHLYVWICLDRMPWGCWTASADRCVLCGFRQIPPPRIAYELPIQSAVASSELLPHLMLSHSPSSLQPVCGIIVVQYTLCEIKSDRVWFMEETCMAINRIWSTGIGRGVQI